MHKSLSLLLFLLASPVLAQSPVADSIIATGVSLPGISPPLCPWPQHPHYSGSGDAKLAENFQCRD